MGGEEVLDVADRHGGVVFHDVVGNYITGGEVGQGGGVGFDGEFEGEKGEGGGESEEKRDGDFCFWCE